MNQLKILKELKKKDLSQYTVSMYVVKRSLKNHIANYNLKFVNIGDKLKKKLKKNASTLVKESNTVKDYDYFTVDQDNNLLGVETSETDMLELINVIETKEDDDFYVVNNDKELLNSWVYITRLTHPSEKPLYFVRKISGGWKINKKISIDLLKFEDNKLMEIGDIQYFKIDNKIDFFVFKGTIFIADKKNFEVALNFREGMIRNRDEVVNEFKVLKLFVNSEKLSELVGTNSNRLRKLSQVKKAGYYKNQEYLKNLRIVSKNKKWGIIYNENGEIDVTNENIDTVLKLLNNDRLNSPINDEEFDVDNKHKI